MFSGLLVGIWLGISSLGITAEQSYDHGFFDDCHVQVVCGAGVDFAEYSHDIADLGTDFTVGSKLYGISAYWDGQLVNDAAGLRYETGNASGLLPEYEWTTLDPFHFLFLRSLTGDLYVAIEDLPAVLPGTSVRTDLDYNDALFRLNPIATTPEPASLLLFGTGLAVAARLRRRRRS